MGCEPTATANDPTAHLIERMDRLQADVSHLNGEVEELQSRVRWGRYPVLLLGLVLGILSSRWTSPW